MGRKKTLVLKDKKKDSGKKYNKSHSTRCNPSDIPKFYKDLLPAKKKLVEEMGFGQLVDNLPSFNFNNVVMMELVDSFNIPDNIIRTNLGKITVNAAKVDHAFELNATWDAYPCTESGH
ncbi:hypothetical protein PIB30_069142 [Stylosanthes scabra]|uniref:Uncharacterized protein n=1 Tax=Stylosanthes scabra TaxID=79078 RepID=A0ABU6UQB6_9FABA|nr:hypothetical protein [Stylosanthes scabra]